MVLKYRLVESNNLVCFSCRESPRSYVYSFLILSRLLGKSMVRLVLRKLARLDMIIFGKFISNLLIYLIIWQIE